MTNKNELPENDVDKDRPGINKKAPEGGGKDRGPIVGPAMKVFGGVSMFIGAIGVGIMALVYLTALMGIWAIPLLLVAGAALTLGGQYLRCRKTNEKFSFVGSFVAQAA